MQTKVHTKTTVNVSKHLCLVLFFTLMLAFNAGYTPVYAAPLADSQLFLPLISGPAPSICGTMLASAAPVVGLNVELILDGTGSGQVLQTVQTNSGGGYCFFSVPALQGTQFYYAKYTNGSAGNPDNNQYANFCVSDVLSAYTGAESATLTVVDVSDIPLTAPDDGAAKSLPGDFQWQVRGASPTDIYQWNLISATSAKPHFIADPVGYVDHYTLAALPPHFNHSTEYKWFVSANRGGSYCKSYVSRQIKFNP